MTPGRTLAATKTIEETAARAVAMTFMAMVPCLNAKWKRCGSDDHAGADAGGDQDGRAQGGESGREDVHEVCPFENALSGGSEDQATTPGTTLAAMNRLEVRMARAAAAIWLWAFEKRVMAVSFRVFLWVPVGVSGDARHTAQAVPNSKKHAITAI
jgi:hypothetical protein